ncbi:MAG TPA: class I SAM-dependent methyltransferase [Candidatus Omnitrophica bacterium]|nr:class I SAM-dependent methyltransferase [Candidatus Omnitrophota bacterium]
MKIIRKAIDFFWIPFNQRAINNKNTYESADIIASFSVVDDLFLPESTILDMLRDKLARMKMLDIGVGGGRTTRNFAPLVKEYFGIDYSKGMIDLCRKKFLELSGKFFFEVCDVRNLGIFKDKYFDFILFSFNGLDCISHEDRLVALKEIKRVCSDGAFFFFSSHNLLSLCNPLNFKACFKLHDLLYKIRNNILIRVVNKDYRRLTNLKYAIINDGAHNFRLRLYYIKPEEQIRQLENLGFNNIGIYSIFDGKKVDKDLDKLTDAWLYYLCQA